MKTQTISFHVETDYEEGGGFIRHPQSNVAYYCRATPSDNMVTWGFGDTPLEAIADWCEEYDDEGDDWEGEE